MTKTTFIFTITTITSIALTGCAHKAFTHDTKTDADFQRDKYDCEMVATQYTANMGFTGNPLIIRDEMQRCLEIKHGWREQKK